MRDWNRGYTNNCFPTVFKFLKNRFVGGSIQPNVQRSIVDTDASTPRGASSSRVGHQRVGRGRIHVGTFGLLFAVELEPFVNSGVDKVPPTVAKTPKFKKSLLFIFYLLFCSSVCLLDSNYVVGKINTRFQIFGHKD